MEGEELLEVRIGDFVGLPGFHVVEFCGSNTCHFPTFYPLSTQTSVHE